MVVSAVFYPTKIIRKGLLIMSGNFSKAEKTADTKTYIKPLPAEWPSIIRDCEISGLSISKYCKQHNLSRDAYRYWRGRVRERAVPMTDSNAQLIIKAGGVEVGINNDTPAELVIKILRLLRHAG